MQLTDQEATDLKAFLVKDLVHRSEADPEVLADYVLVLLKHEQPLHELRKMFSNQLEDFLKEQTIPFVTRLFTVLQTKEYMKKNAQPTAATPPPPYPIEDDDDGERNFKHARSEVIPEDNTRKRTRDTVIDGVLPHLAPPVKRQDMMDDRRRSTDGKPTIDVERLGPANTINARNNRFNNNLPQSSQLNNMHNNNNLNRFGQQQQQPQQQPAYRPNKSNYQYQQPTQQGGFMRNNGNNMMNNNANNINNRLGGVMGGNRMIMAGSFQMSPVPNQAQNQIQQRRQNQRLQKCRDYEERGFCLRGDDCPFDHGQDKIVLEDPMGAFAGTGPIIQPNIMPYTARPATVSTSPGFQNPYGSATVMGARPLGYGQANGVEGQAPQQYNSPFQVQSSPLQMQPKQRPMITSGYQGNRNTTKLGGGREYGTPDNTTLVIYNIPADKLSLDAVNSYFKKYGTIIQLKIIPGTTKAIVQFSQHNEAMIAFQDPEPVFSNRFVRIFWMRPEDFTLVGVDPTSGTMGSSRTAFTPRQQREPPIISAAELLARPLTPAASGPTSSIVGSIAPPPTTPKPQITAIKTQSTALMSKLMEEQKLVLGMMEKAKTSKEKAELKVMFDTISSKLAELLEEGKAVATKVAISTSSISPANNSKQLLEQKKKEALDRELEDIQRSTSGVSFVESKSIDMTKSPDTNSRSKTAEKKSPDEILADLKNKAASLGIDTNATTTAANNALVNAGALTPVGSRGRGRGTLLRGRSTPRGAGTSRFNLDLRPRTLMVKGFENATQESVKAHFEQFGSTESIETSRGDVVLVKYTTRKEAEIAIARGLKVAGLSTPLTMSFQSSNTSSTLPLSSSDALPAANEEQADEGERCLYHEDDLYDERHFKRN